MREAGQVAIMPFPTVGLAVGKPRPVVLIASVPGPHDDWLICMMSTQLQHAQAGFDEVIDTTAADFQGAGVKVSSVIRVARLAVVPADMLVGTIGKIGADRLQRIRQTLAQ